MEIRARTKGKILILDLSGKIDVNSSNFVECIGQCIQENYLDILCNLQEVESIDYMGMSVVCIVYKNIINHKGRMKFTNIPAHIKEMFSIVGLDKTIEIYFDEDTALHSFEEDKVIEKIQKTQLRRRFKRLPLGGIKIELKEKYDKTAKCLEVDVLDLSALGAYIYGCNKFKIGDEVVLTLKFSPKTDPAKIDAKVVWLSDKEIQQQIHPGMGVQFHNIPADLQEELLSFIDKNLSYSEKHPELDS